MSQSVPNFLLLHVSTNTTIVVNNFKKLPIWYLLISLIQSFPSLHSRRNDIVRTMEWAIYTLPTRNEFTFLNFHLVRSEFFHTKQSIFRSVSQTYPRRKSQFIERCFSLHIFWDQYKDIFDQWFENSVILIE